MRQEQSLLIVAMKKLSLDHVETLQLYYWEGLSVAEIASIQDVQPGTVKSKLFRARKRLEEEIEKAALQWCLGRADDPRARRLGPVDVHARCN